MLGITQGAPRVVKRGLHGAGEVFALGQTTGQGTGQGATGTVITARQTLAGIGFAQAIAAIQAVVDFGFVAVAAGDQQVFDERQEFFSALVRGAFGQFGEDAGFGKVGGRNDRQGQQTLAHGVADFVLAQASAAAGAQHRIANHRQMRVRRKQFDHGVDHFQGTEHAQFDRRDFGVVEHGIGLGQYPLTVKDAEVRDIDGVLHGQGGDGRSRMATLSEQGFDICLQAGATTWVVAGETEDNGARAVDIHGARAYHQTCFPGVVAVCLVDTLWRRG
ncbi:hypothetical protein EMIT0P4_40147 [Pseudomonas sp. IT-P4]